MIKASVIIISYNNLHSLRKTLNSLICQEYDHNDISVELIVADSGSKIETLNVLQRYKHKVKIILKPQFLSRLSPAEARNMGVGDSKGDILIFSDADCILPSTWIRDIVECFKANPRIDCVFGSREPDSGPGFGNFIRRFNFILYSNKLRILKSTIVNKKSLAENKQFISLSGNNFAVRKNAWLNLGGMKTTFKNPAGEDIMLENDLIEKNYNLLFDPSIKVTHFHPAKLIDLFKKFANYGESNYAVSKHPDSLISHKCFVDRGHQLSVGEFIIALSYVCFITFFLILSRLSLFSILFGVFTLFIIIAFRLKLLKKKLSEALALMGDKYKKKYSLPIFQLFFFDLINFTAKTITLLSFFRCYLLRNTPTLDLLLKKKSNDYFEETMGFRQKTGFDFLKGCGKPAGIGISCSVIIPFCNNYSFLERNLHALCKQNVSSDFKKNNIEIIVINDGSPVKLEKSLGEIANTYPTTYFKLKKNHGAASARNLGLLYAKKRNNYFSG